MKQFAWSRKGETKWTDAEVELLLQQQSRFVVAEEVGPLKDQVKELKKTQTETATTTAAAAKEAAKELKELKDTNAALLVEVEPARETAKLSKRKVLAKGIIKDEQVADAFKLAGIEDGDSDEEIKAKLTTAASTREYMKAAVETAEQIAAREAAEKAAKIAEGTGANLTPEQLAAIAHTGKPAPTEKTLAQLAAEDIELSADDEMPQW